MNQKINGWCLGIANFLWVLVIIFLLFIRPTERTNSMLYYIFTIILIIVSAIIITKLAFEDIKK